MTVSELRHMLFDVEDQDAEVVPSRRPRRPFEFAWLIKAQTDQVDPVREETRELFS